MQLSNVWMYAYVCIHMYFLMRLCAAVKCVCVYFAAVKCFSAPYEMNVGVLFFLLFSYTAEKTTCAYHVCVYICSVDGLRQKMYLIVFCPAENTSDYPKCKGYAGTAMPQALGGNGGAFL